MSVRVHEPPVVRVHSIPVIELAELSRFLRMEYHFDVLPSIHSLTHQMSTDQKACHLLGTDLVLEPEVSDELRHRNPHLDPACISGLH